MKDNNIEELFYSLMEDSEFITQLNDCDSEQAIIELLSTQGIPAKRYEELKSNFHDNESLSEDMNGGQVCILIGFGNETEEIGCKKEGEIATTGEKRKGAGLFHCMYVGIGGGGVVRKDCGK